MTLSMIVAMTRDGVIGRDNDMPWHLPADLAYFKQTTLGKPVVMGRNTYVSIGRPLPGRRNVIVSRALDEAPAGTELVPSPEAALALLGDAEEVMVMGGGQLYAAMLPLAQRLYITRIDASIEGDTRFPDIDTQAWKLVSEEVRAADERNQYDCRFQILERLK
ncbi:type 3 dihydrofolate reductase [Oceanimonas baumannii]|uniref:Dihydrofolate reductase n=1 Tax=Oceanimonas baumannii TaxID=129578 RepID=A0A235CEI1_9GAMM|nr:type 3 dihydrofolate reductase [Oceanimonas baumannii]OYD22950.1 dihydrofolate reductase [Oceanimonas baumannii]TDW54048.1 dihydrofolate reductase [Oceanimonas baumannii]